MDNPDEKIKELVNYLENTVEATLSELRAMIMELKPAIMEAHGLTEAVRLQSELVSRRRHYELDLDLQEVSGLSPEQEMALKNMEARCRENGGNLQILSGPGRGTRIEARFTI